MVKEGTDEYHAQSFSFTAIGTNRIHHGGSSIGRCDQAYGDGRTRMLSRIALESPPRFYLESGVS
ncbi:hypothetical protein COMA2_80035 [Candidatus Nitrospira nitrificans]|uniref:Uncharacterized protein n=1 Tax=Candidatus Nitrospira nitrificans TaxID=1742973 RepID=A0A0S4LUI3_9BACT|nr:hypothetical protein COMA2_80035 [Candidatus Nitrospira nitrificans]